MPKCGDCRYLRSFTIEDGGVKHFCVEGQEGSEILRQLNEENECESFRPKLVVVNEPKPAVDFGGWLTAYIEGYHAGMLAMSGVILQKAGGAR